MQKTLNCTYFVHYLFCPIRLIHLIKWKFAYFDKKNYVAKYYILLEWNSLKFFKKYHLLFDDTSQFSKEY